MLNSPLSQRERHLFFEEISMTVKKSITACLTLVALLLTFGLANDADAKRRRKVAKDPDAPTNREAKVLGWGPVKTPNRGKNPEFMIRGVVLDIEKVKDRQNYYTLKILPIEILNNHQRVIGFDHFLTGVDIVLFLPKSKVSELKEGRMVEYNQYYTEEVEQAIGGAKMVAMTLHKDIQGYPAGAGAYLKLQGFYPIQYKNALKGAKLHKSGISGDQAIKANLDILATSSEDPELKTSARASYVEFFKSEPTGKCKYVDAEAIFKCL